MDDLSMGAADFERIIKALADRKVRITINALPAAERSKDWELDETLASDRLARHELGVRGVWVHDANDMSSTHFLEELCADPDQQKRLIELGAMWVGPAQLAPR